MRALANFTRQQLIDARGVSLAMNTCVNTSDIAKQPKFDLHQYRILCGAQN